MTQEEKQLLLVDLSARLPYGVIINCIDPHFSGSTNEKLYSVNWLEQTVMSGEWTNEYNIDNIKPYLRPMSSMTDEEKRVLQSFYPGSFGNQWLDIENETIDIFEYSSTITLYLNDNERIVDWLNKKMFDYRGLIEEGLAIEAPEGMYEK